MSRLDDLPPDQLAALSLVLRQRKSYAEVAELLSIQERAVHDRAHAALAVLAPRQARELTAARREDIGDYLLGRQTGARRLGTRAYLEGSPPARAWANMIAAELAPLAAAPLPEIPGRPPVSLPSSRVGGALLLAAIAAIVVIAVLLLTGGGGGSHKTTTAGASSTANGSTTAKTSTPTEDKRISLTSSDLASKAVGAAEVLSEGNKYAFYLAAQHLPPSRGFFYAVWLYNSPTSYEALGRSPNVGSNGKLQGGALLPVDAANYHRMLLTRETNSHPTRPGRIVLSGSFALH